MLNAEVELLAKALAKYADCLCVKRARMTSLHVSSIPALMVGNALTVEFISSRLTVPTELDAFSAAVGSAGVNVAVDIDSLLPSDRRQQYDRIQLQDAGLPAELEGVVCVKMYCNELIERLYSANFDDICVYCTGNVPPWSNVEALYPQCDDCADKPRIANVKKS